jgi:phage baseplate assembly protein W
MIAQNELGDAALWLDLALLNDLAYPFVDTIPSKGVVIPGDYLSIPMGEGVDSDPSLVYGQDLLLTTDKFSLTNGTNGDLIESNGDFSIIDGVQTLKQDLFHRLLTPLGTLPYHPDFGSNIPMLIGEVRTDEWRVKIGIEVSRTFRSDARVIDVTNMVVEPIDNGVTIECDIITDVGETRLKGTI